MKDNKTNNWQEIAEELAIINIDDDVLFHCNTGKEQIVDTILQAMGLVFESTKQKCAKEAEIIDLRNLESSEDFMVDSDSIFNIDKPNLKLDE